ncbi:DUF3943 domain-containing protein [Bdellovibrio sp. SKB1291214]|uniref:DUF3943 domain-containing protein n=1 Tax=Bdellovibrio sp. SKB1291214 TaxID=1732569 RepID=UPI0015952E97|nr:DUF3943 domain-containing protein [Bdellovibrio sp. SKB1291214]UYL07926.1 DUF3943 domain-containing protein [Bdellovibrio sp. SKB1291214]
MLISPKFFSSLILSVAVLFSVITGAEESAPVLQKNPTGLYEEYKQIPKAEFEKHERLKNFAIMYGLQWIVYGVTQYHTIKEHGSFHNWIRNPWHADYDKDTYDYNIFKHSLSGELYYQYYRSRGYSEQESFLWAVASSTAFEFTIETVTEVPSYQDLYQTPVLGTVVGVGMEKLSLYFHSKKTWPNRLLGYFFNPFTLLSHSQYGYVTVPVVTNNYKGIQISWSFQ